MKKNLVLLMLALVLAAAGCAKNANCKPCKFNADEQKIDKSMQKIEPTPVTPK